MTPDRLPNGFAVQLDHRVRLLGNGAAGEGGRNGDRGLALIGGTPTRLLRLTPPARAMFDGDSGKVVVRDEPSAKLARILLDATVAHPRPNGGPTYRDVTVVIPVRDNLAGLLRLLTAVRRLAVIVVDDGSATPVRVEDLPQRAAPTEVLRHPRSRGPAAARNTGLAACRTDFVAFLDSDVVPNNGWLERLLGHFADPAVVLVAPRIIGRDGAADQIGRYEAVRSALDLGKREAPVIPYTPVAYVPSAAMVCRSAALRGLGGFDEGLRSGEDVDLCWRMVDAGMRLRYEPIATVCHDHRRSPSEWLARKAFYGGSAAPLAARHPDKIAPVRISGNALLAWAMLMSRSRLGWLGAAVALVAMALRIWRLLRPHGAEAPDIAAILLRGFASAGRQLVAAIWRHFWPVVLPMAMVSQRMRRIVIAAAVADGTVDWWRHSSDEVEPIGLPTYLLLKCADDLAYGAGLWAGALRQHSAAALRPQIRPQIRT